MIFGHMNGQVIESISQPQWQYESYGRFGWECPKCGKVWSPYTTCCDCHKKKTSKKALRGEKGE